MSRTFETRIIPAYAGSTAVSISSAMSVGDHPRIRGEHLAQEPPAPAGGGSSPHTRGALSNAARSQSTARIIPAYAGSTTAKCPALTRTADHPRIRGEHSQ